MKSIMPEPTGYVQRLINNGWSYNNFKFTLHDRTTQDYSTHYYMSRGKEQKEVILHGSTMSIWSYYA